MIWLFLLCLVIGIYCFVRTVVRSARVVVAPQTEVQRENRSKLWWSLGVPLTIAASIIVVTFIGMAVYFAFHPESAPK